jgi:hypothetical protein
LHRRLRRQWSLLGRCAAAPLLATSSRTLARQARSSFAQRDHVASVVRARLVGNWGHWPITSSESRRQTFACQDGGNACNTARRGLGGRLRAEVPQRTSVRTLLSLAALFVAGGLTLLRFSSLGCARVTWFTTILSRCCLTHEFAQPTLTRGAQGQMSGGLTWPTVASLRMFRIS